MKNENKKKIMKIKTTEISMKMSANVWSHKLTVRAGNVGRQTIMKMNNKETDDEIHTTVKRSEQCTSHQQCADGANGPLL